MTAPKSKFDESLKLGTKGKNPSDTDLSGELRVDVGRGTLRSMSLRGPMRVYAREGGPHVQPEKVAGGEMLLEVRAEE